MKSVVRDYLKKRNVVVFKATPEEKFHRIIWGHQTDCGGFKDGWGFQIINDNVIIRYKFRDITSDALLREIWLDVKGMYEPNIGFYDGSEPYLFTCLEEGDFEMNSGEQFIDKRLAQMTETIFSLMTRYYDRLIREGGNFEEMAQRFGHTAFSVFVDKNFPCAYDEPCLDLDVDEICDFFDETDKHFTPADDMHMTKLQKKQEISDEPRGFAAIAGMDELKATLDEKVLWTLTHEQQAAKYKVKAPAGMLLYGPPGCGKTYFAEKFAEESSMNFHLVKPSDLGDRYLHGTQTLIAEMFNKAREEAPCIICIDEIDAVVPARGSEDANNRGNEINEFLTQMNTAAKDKLFIIGTTNRKDMIDPALLRSGRMELMVEIPAPDQKLRESMFRFHLDGRPVDENVDFEKLAKLTEGYTSSDIVAIVNSAAIKAARADILISENLLEDAIKATPSSLKNKKESVRRPIGFKPVLV